jgi:signal transduction histidine kinase
MKITVRDHGVGLDPADLERIFDPFHRSARVQRSTTGTGLGLAIARGLLAAEEGRVWGENVDDGAQFTIAVRGRVRAAGARSTLK